MRLRTALALLLLVWCGPATVLAENSLGVRPLYRGLEAALATLPPHTHPLLERAAIEHFLVELDERPPDWRTVYGQGHHDPGHDERLLTLNRERDARRAGKGPLQWLIAFVWFGELSRFDDQAGGFPVALGPKFTTTGWGDVRFKHEDLPITLLVLAGDQSTCLKTRLSQGDPVEVYVLMSGRLIPKESLIYDFSHEEEGRGLIMPVVRIEAVEFALKGGHDGRE